MGCLILMPSLHCDKLFSLTFIILSFIQLTSCLHDQLCPQDQRSALLQFKKYSSFDKSVSVYCDYFGIPSHPKPKSWNESTNCCSWDGVECDRLTGDVVALDLSCSQLNGTIHPNSSLFLLTHIQRLNLAYNSFLFSRISSSFARFTELTHLNLSYSGFSSEISSEIFTLSNLVSLDLSFNDVRLEKPGLELLAQNLTKLRELELDYVDISSAVPNSLLNLTSLIHLSLYSCGLQGRFPDGVFHLPNLKVLDLAENNALSGYLPKQFNWSSPLQSLGLAFTSFSGELTDSIGNLKSLKLFDLQNCQFSGSIPASLGNLTQITHLLLSSNQFSGMVPPSLSNLQQLISLGLSSMSINGTIPSGIFTLPALAYLNLSDNNLTGQIYDFQPNSSLREIVLNNNKLHGVIPSSIFELANLTCLVLSSNNLSGNVELGMFSKLKNLRCLSLAHNSLSLNTNINANSTLPQFSMLHLSSLNLRKFPAFLRTQENLRYLDLSENNIHGRFPSFVCSFNSLRILDLSDNFLTGALPYCLGNFSTSLMVLDLHKNYFSGPITNTFAKENTLLSINLNGNGLEGPIPKSLVNCRALEVLDIGNNRISGSFPYWLESLPRLRVLILRSNQFHGSIRTSTTKFPFPILRVFDISDNAFIGPIPAKYFENFEAMMNIDESKLKRQYMWYYYHFNSFTMTIKGSILEIDKLLAIFTTIDLSKNKFGGEIPQFIGKLNSLRGLNLSFNDLTGPIPASLENLRVLEWLDLSSNKLVGQIPRQLSNLTFLAVLNLSHNQLSGDIPRGNQFSTFTEKSYSDNPGLCGLPLLKKCIDSEAAQPPPSILQQDDSSESPSDFDWKATFLGYGCGLLFGFAIGCLVFSTGTPIWFVRIAEIVKQRNGRRSSRPAYRYRSAATLRHHNHPR